MSSRGIILTLFACQLIAVVWAAKRVDAHLRARETMKQRRSREQTFDRRDETPLDSAELFQLTKGEALVYVREAANAVGTKVERLEETYNGIKVYDTFVTVRKTKDGQLTGDATGTLIQGIEEDLPDTEAILPDEKTLQIAVHNEGDEFNDVDDEKYYSMIYMDNENRARLVNIVSYLIDGVKRPFYIIDVKTGDILKHWQGLNTYPCCERKYKAWGGNEKIGRITYGDMPHCLTPTIVNGTCYLENQYVRIVDMQNTFHKNITETASFNCKKGYGDEINGAYSPAIDAFFYGTVVGKMFEEWFGSAPLNEKIIIRVHFGVLVENAFWTGETATLGDGRNRMYPLTSLDVVGHEIAHGVTEQGSSLEYIYQSGGVNEAFSDIIGEAAEDYLLNSDDVTGYSIMKHEAYLREFERPENDNISMSQVADVFKDTNPHLSSGVYRRVWWIVVRDNGVPIRDAAAVFLHANRMYWHSTASFYDCACGTLKAALDLGHDTAPFRKAFKDVGLDDCDVNTHIYGLNNNETLTGVLVSGTINPVYKMKTPKWADKLIVDVTPSLGKCDHSGIETERIVITIMTNGWEQTDDECTSAEVVAVGFNRVVVPDAYEQEYYFKLSTSNVTDIVDVYSFTNASAAADSGVYMVDLTVGYTCQQNFTSVYGPWMYMRDCGYFLY